MPLLVLAYLGSVSVGLPEGMLGVAWPHMRADFAVPLGAVGLLLIVGTAGYVIAGIATGFTLDRIGVGRILAGTAALSAVALLGYGLSPVLLMVAVLALLVGTGQGAMDTALNTYVAGRFGARQINWLHASFGFGATVGPLVMTGVLAAGLVWRWGYGVVAVLVAGLAAAYLATVRSWRDPPPASSVPPGGSVPPAGPGIAVPSSWRTLAQPGLWLGSGAFVIQVAIEITAGLWAYTLLTSGRGMPEHLAGLSVSAFWGSMFVARLLYGMVTDRIGVHRVLTAGVVGMAVAAALIAVPAAAWLAVAGLVLLGLSAAPMFPLLILTTRQRVGAAHTDRTIGVQVGAAAVGGAAGPALVGALIDRSGPEILGGSLLVLALLLAVVYGWSRRIKPEPAVAAVAVP